MIVMNIVILKGEIINGNKLCEDCGSGSREESMLLCDHCNKGHHMTCLRPVIVIPPNDDWLCHSCSISHLQAFDDMKTVFKKDQVYCY